jgi:23S rRNA (uracil1939-C5)-methyltransferase
MDVPGDDETIVAEIHGIGAEGAGVGRLPDGRAVFAHRTAPGDRVRLCLDRVKKHWARGRLVGVLEPGPERREAPCPHYARCGGCVLEHLTYDAQLAANAERVAEALRRIGKLRDLPRAEVHGAPREFRYRNRATFTLRRLSRGRVVAGFHELDRPGRIVDLGGECLLLEPAVAEGWEAVRGAWGPGAAHLPAGPELRLTVRGLADGSSILLVEGGDGEGDPDRLLAGAQGVAAVWLAPRPGAEASLAAGEPSLEEAWLGERIPIRPGAFLQVNREGARVLLELVLREVGPAGGARIVDAYCGIGVYARRLAGAGAATVGIERSARAVGIARRSPIAGLRILEGRVEDRIGEALPAERVILNPPRQGVGEGVMEAIAGARPGPERIVYVSCDPATLARDLVRLGSGFEVAGLAVVDLFPQTAHVETVATLHSRERT